MQKALKKIVHLIKNIILFILKVFFSFFSSKKEVTEKQAKKENITLKNNLITNEKKIEEDESTDAPRELFKEYINHKKYKIAEEEFQEEINKIIEKLFKIKIKELPKEENEKLKKYTKKIFPKINNDIKNEIIKNKEELEKSLIIKIKKDSQENGIKMPLEPINEKNIEQVPLSSKDIYISNVPKAVEVKNTQTILNKKLEENKKTETKDRIEKHLKNTQKIISSPSTQQEYKSVNTTIPLNIASKKIKVKELDSENINKQKEDVIRTFDEIVTSSLVKEEMDFKDDNSLKEEIQEEIKKEAIENKTEIVKEVELEQNERNAITMNEKKEDKKQVNASKDINNEIKKQEIPLMKIPLEKIANQNNQVMEQAEIEIKKEEFIEKDYERIEQLLNDKINDLEALLNKPLKEEQKEKINKEIKRLKNTKEKVALNKEKDLEEIRVALESSIPLEEIEQVKQNLKKLYENDEIKKHQNLINNIAYLSVEEIKRIEKILIKESLRKTLKKLEIPLFLSFPFIKNKYFRRFVSGLFVFRSLGFIKNMLFGIPSNYEPVDLFYLQKGSDALDESIEITLQNLSALEEVKRTTLLKYPELTEDEEFLSYVNKIEENLEKNYQKLLKQDKVVKKYFNKSKVLVRKRKKDF